MKRIRGRGSTENKTRNEPVDFANRINSHVCGAKISLTLYAYYNSLGRTNTITKRRRIGAKFARARINRISRRSSSFLSLKNSRKNDALTYYFFLSLSFSIISCANRLSTHAAPQKRIPLFFLHRNDFSRSCPHGPLVLSIVSVSFETRMDTDMETLTMTPFRCSDHFLSPRVL